MQVIIVYHVLCRLDPPKLLTATKFLDFLVTSFVARSWGFIVQVTCLALWQTPYYDVGGFFNQLKSTCIRHAVLEGLNVRTTWIPRIAPESMILCLNTHPTTEFPIPITQRNFE